VILIAIETRTKRELFRIFFSSVYLNKDVTGAFVWYVLCCWNGSKRILFYLSV